MSFHHTGHLLCLWINKVLLNEYQISLYVKRSPRTDVVEVSDCQGLFFCPVWFSKYWLRSWLKRNDAMGYWKTNVRPRSLTSDLQELFMWGLSAVGSTTLNISYRGGASPSQSPLLRKIAPTVLCSVMVTSCPGPWPSPRAMLVARQWPGVNWHGKTTISTEAGICGGNRVHNCR